MKDRSIGFPTRLALLWGIIGFVATLGTPNLAEADATPPGDPDTGYGSTSLESCQRGFWWSKPCEKKFTFGGGYHSAERTTVFMPRDLRDVDTAPVVVYLHGFFTLVPEIYETHIRHLTRQGYIVVFPQFQGGLWGLISETGVFQTAVQQNWLDTAVASVDEALDRIGPAANRNQIYGYGHSLGGALLLGWEASGGVALAGLVLSHAQIDPSAGLPEFVAAMTTIEPIDWESKIGAISCPVMILTGDADDIASPESAVDIYEALENVDDKVLYEAMSDNYGKPGLIAEHFTPMTDGGLIELLNPWLSAFGGRIEMNSFDWRFYHAALDAMLDGSMKPDFDMGRWSDGTPVNPIQCVAGCSD